MKARLALFALVTALAASLSSCGAAGSVVNQANRVVQALGRTVTGR
jgi:hypothetical protein